jgi:hypothetical protein
MAYLILCLLVSVGLFAQTVNVAALLSGTPVVYEIDPTERGADIIKMVTTYNSAPFKGPSSEVVLQTRLRGTAGYAPAVVNGLIPYVQSIATATNGTLFIVTYLTPDRSIPQYIVVPVEQIVAVAYSPIAIPTTGFTSVNGTGVLPFYSIDLADRAADIQNVVNTLLTTAPYKTSISGVTIQTSLSGPYNPPIAAGGIIPNVKSVSLAFAPNKTMMLISYLSQAFIPGTIAVSVEQVQQVIYLPVNP